MIYWKFNKIYNSWAKKKETNLVELEGNPEMKMLSYVNLYNAGTTFLKVLIIYRDKKKSLHIVLTFENSYNICISITLLYYNSDGIWIIFFINRKIECPYYHS